MTGWLLDTEYKYHVVELFVGDIVWSTQSILSTSIIIYRETKATQWKVPFHKPQLLGSSTPHCTLN